MSWALCETYWTQGKLHGFFVPLYNVLSVDSIAVMGGYTLERIWDVGKMERKETSKEGHLHCFVESKCELGLQVWHLQAPKLHLLAMNDSLGPGNVALDWIDLKGTSYITLKLDLRKEVCARFPFVPPLSFSQLFPLFLSFFQLKAERFGTVESDGGIDRVVERRMVKGEKRERIGGRGGSFGWVWVLSLEWFGDYGGVGMVGV